MTRPTTRATVGSVWDRLGTPLRALVWLLVAAAALAIYREAETFVANVFSIVLLFIFASIIAVVLTPLVDRAQQLPWLRSHRGVAVLLLYAVFASGLAGVGFLILPTLISQGRQIPELVGHVQTQLHTWGIDVDLSALRASLTNTNVSSQLGLVSGVIGTAINVILVVVISIYLLIDGRAVIATLRNVFPTHTRVFDFMALAVGSTTEAYVRGQVIISLVIGAYTTVTLAFLGVHFAVVLGVAAAILELVPLLGGVIALVLAVAVALLQSPGLGLAALAVGLVGHGLVAYVVGPHIIGRATQLHPLVAMAAMLVGAEVAGVLGALFAIPVAAAANIALGALYRSERGDTALTTHDRGKIEVETLPRLGDEIGGVEKDGIVNEPVPRKKRS